MLRLKPVEKPATLKGKLAFFALKRRFGKIMTPAKVVYARAPKAWNLARAISEYHHKHISLPPDLCLLVQSRVAHMNKCGFCIDIGNAFAIRAGVNAEKLAAINEYRTNAMFTERERAAIAYAEEITATGDTSDAAFEALKRHFSEQEIVELTLLNAIENFYNLVNRPLGIESDGFCVVPALARPHQEGVTATA